MDLKSLTFATDTELRAAVGGRLTKVAIGKGTLSLVEDGTPSSFEPTSTRPLHRVEAETDTLASMKYDTRLALQQAQVVQTTAWAIVVVEHSAMEPAKDIAEDTAVDSAEDIVEDTAMEPSKDITEAPSFALVEDPS